MTASKKTLYIMDGHGLIYRAYYAFLRRPLFTTKGENTSAVHGFMRMLLKLLKDESPDFLVCALDSKEKTFRHELFPDYKQKRQKAPEDLLSQAETIRELLVKLGVAMLASEGWEADDIIGTLTDAAKRAGARCVIVSSDKDVLQLVGEDVTVLASRKGTADMERVDAGKVLEDWKVPPEAITDLLALMGDQSDGVPGVKGIGESGAVKLIREFGSLERVYGGLPSVGSERTRGLLEKGREAAFLSKRLVTIRRDVPLDFRLESFSLSGFPREEGLAMLAEKELASVVAELRPGGRPPGAGRASLAGAPPGGMTFGSAGKVSARAGAAEGHPAGGETDGGPPPEPKRGVYHPVETEADLAGLGKKIAEAGVLSLDTESTGLDPTADDLIGVSLAVREGEGFYIPVRNKSGSAPGAGLMGDIKHLLEDERIKKIGQNLKYDYVLLRKEGIAVKGIAGDTMVAAYLLDPQKQRYSLDDLAKELLDYTTIRYTDVVKSKDQTLLDVPLEEVVRYSGEDSDVALRLHSVLLKRLEEHGLGRLYEEIEVPLLVVLGKMEHAGVRIDTGHLAKMSVAFGEEIDGLVGRVHELAGEEFNVRSTKQLSEVLFGRMKLPVVKKTKTGISTDESVLVELAATYEIARVLLRHRTLAKLKSTYIDALPLLVNPRTGRVHTSFNQTVATTGRLSSSNPNLQNIPIREEEGRAIRRGFIPEEGWAFLSADYSQIELRILASITGDENLRKAFLADRDVHRETASLLFGVDVDAVKDHQRAVAKTINYSITYGISPFGLSRRLGIPKSAAAELIGMYFKKYGGVARYFEDVVESAKEKGYVETLLGRRRPVPEIRSSNKTVFETARRVVLNTPIQGTAADLIKKAMVIIDRELERRRMRSRMLIQVHDELVFEAPGEECEELSGLVREKMAGAIAFDVPIGVNVSIGKNWEEAHRSA